MFLKEFYNQYKNIINESVFNKVKKIKSTEGMPITITNPLVAEICADFGVDPVVIEKYIEENGLDFLEDERFWAVQDLTGTSPINIIKEEDNYYDQPTYKVFCPDDQNHPYEVYSVWTEDEEEKWFRDNGSDTEEEIYGSSNGGQQVYAAIQKGWLNGVTLEDVFPFDYNESECIDEFVDAEYKSVEEFIEEYELEFDYEVDEYSDINWDDVPQYVIDKICEEVETHWFDELCQWSEPDWDVIADAVWNQDGILGFISTYDRERYEGTSLERLGEETFNIYRHE